jgi:hypothetical protein
MVGVWSADVLVVTVQLSDFRGVAEGTRFGRHIFFYQQAIGDKVPPS